MVATGASDIVCGCVGVRVVSKKINFSPPHDSKEVIRGRMFFVLSFLWVCGAEVVLRDSSTGVAYCNSSQGLESYNFSFKLCQERLFVTENGAILVDNGTILSLGGDDDVLSVEITPEGSLEGIKTNGTDHFYFSSNGVELLLQDLNFSLPGVSAWDPATSTYWTVGDSNVGRQLKFYKVDTLNNYSTGFYTISTGEPPVNVFWNGTDVVGIVERNSTYYTVAFLRNSRKTLLSSTIGVELLINRRLGAVAVLPVLENITYLCFRECSIVSHSPTPTPNTVQVSSYTLPSIVVSNAVSFSVSGTLVPITVPGRLVITEGTVVTLTIDEADLVAGDVVTLFNYAELQGSFASLELLSDDSCEHYEGQLEYGENQVRVVITVSSNFCTAGSRVVNVFL